MTIATTIMHVMTVVQRTQAIIVASLGRRRAMHIIVTISTRWAAHAYNYHYDKGHQNDADHNAHEDAQKWAYVLNDGGIGQREICEGRQKWEN